MGKGKMERQHRGEKAAHKTLPARESSMDLLPSHSAQTKAARPGYQPLRG